MFLLNWKGNRDGAANGESTRDKLARADEVIEWQAADFRS
jgi:hypothetical protein